MDDSAPSWSEYLREVVRHAKDTFSLYSLAVAIVALIAAVVALLFEGVPPWVSATAAILAGIFAFVAILAGGFYAWRDCKAQQRQRARFDIAAAPIRFDTSPSKGLYPAEAGVRFRVDLDVRNGTGELIQLHRPQLDAFEVGANPLQGEASVDYVLLNLPHASQALGFPFGVESGSRPQIRAELTVRHNFRSMEHIAAHLRDFGPYRIRFTYQFEDMGRQSREGFFEINSSLADYARRLAADWKKHNVRKLVDVIRENSPEMLEA